MTHYTTDEWQKYVRNELDSSTREELEAHLYTCEQCLEHYLQAVESNESSLPTISNEQSFTDCVMLGISEQKAVPDTKREIIREMVPDTKDYTKDNTKDDTQKKPFYQQALFHYLLAAVATLFLMFSGAFQSLLKYTSSIDSHLVEERKPSVTEGVMNKTFAWMDSLEKKEAIKK
ncbi:anti-sigma factor family protein [Neobacillus kokaensis]|uniref:Anti-sigma-W factor RsiW n=1 Tax=Neobacillus kokaensis TaxID=2759023 RepID=A0ABQ3N9V3_9BACI|nr:hypothetical protein [Neobacillus kokaensis]GHI00609.1 hypothetical protein AM1BK_41510 [Neobacillus kokaensis]